MAGNTYKKNTSSTEKEKAPKKQLKLNVNWTFLSDPRFQLTSGLFFVVFAIALFIAFTSYLFTGKADQSIVESFWGISVMEDGLEIENWLGIMGASLSYLLIYKWFGIASYLFIPVLYLLGIKIIYKKEMPYLRPLTKVSVFFIFWTTLVLGYVAINVEGFIHQIAGGYGFAWANFLNNIAGWGTALILLFAIAVFGIYFFDIKSPGDIKNVLDNTSDEEDEDEESALVCESFEDEAEQFRSHIQEVEEEEQFEVVEKQPEPIEEKTIIAFDDIPPIAKPIKQPSADLELELGDVADEPIISDDEELGLDINEGVEEEFDDELGNYDSTLDLPHYKYPTLDLLQDFSGNKVQVTREELEANKDRIVQTLGHYKIGISSIKATIGPTVTLYEIVPEAGVKISKIKNLEDDIALSLAALGIRIIAPIPGKGTIGIEVPNTNREIVSIRSVFSTEKFMKSDMALPVALGKTISNEIFVVDLSKMPHLLMAGATGQGKSVGINVLLASLLYKKHPSQLKFVLVDPKKVELSIFSKIEKHFLAKLPDGEEAIITDTKKVVHTLNSLCIEMDSRYDLLKEANCRNLKEYNAKFVKRKLNPLKGHKYMPYIVVVIDELADLMMTAGKEVETPIARLAQLARAIGIHLVVATQRPSVNVITGIIKANFPARLSFKVTSKIDSRTILDGGGADQLIGMGDMLYTQGSDLTRVQCAFIDTPEVEKLVDFIGDQRGYSSAFYLPEFFDENDSTSHIDLSDRDAMFDEAARMIVTHQQGSTSLLQRKLQLGYNRAGRIIDQLEAAGVVGAFQGSKARDVLIQDEHSLEQLLNELNGLK